MHDFHFMLGFLKIEYLNLNLNQIKNSPTANFLKDINTGSLKFHFTNSATQFLLGAFFFRPCKVCSFVFVVKIIFYFVKKLMYTKFLPVKQNIRNNI